MAQTTTKTEETKEVQVNESIIINFKSHASEVLSNLKGAEAAAISCLKDLIGADKITLKEVKDSVLKEYIKKERSSTYFTKVRAIVNLMLQGVKLQEAYLDYPLSNIENKLKTDKAELQRKQAAEAAKKAAEQAAEISKNDKVLADVKLHVEAQKLEAEAKELEVMLQQEADEKKRSELKKAALDLKESAIQKEKEAALIHMETAAATGDERKKESAKKKIDSLKEQEEKIKKQKESTEVLHKALVNQALEALQALKKLKKDELSDRLVSASDNDLRTLLKVISPLVYQEEEKETEAIAA